MSIPIDILSLVAESTRREQVGDARGAEAGYLQAIRLLGDAEPVYRGILYINLGTNAQRAGRIEDAAAFFRNSIALLETQKGDAYLQCAHAHFNLAHQLLHYDDPAAVTHAAEASRRYHANPYAEPVDRADASMLSVLCRLFIEQRADERSFEHTWAEVRTVSARDLNPLLLENFLINFLMYRQVRARDFAALQAEVRAWLPSPPNTGKLAELLAE